MTQEVALIKIIPDGTASVSSGKGGSSGGMGAVLKGLGIGSAIGAVLGIVGNLKFLTNMIGAGIKMISFILKPIADVIMVLLMPILFILKPIMQLVNQVMAPFTKLAMDVMREGQKKFAEGDVVGGMGTMSAAGGIMMSGLSSVLMALQSQTVKLLVDIVISLSKTIMDVLITSMQGIATLLAPSWMEDNVVTFFDKIREGSTTQLDFLGDNLKLGIDMITAVGIASSARAAAELAQAVGVDVFAFKNDASDMIKSIFGGEDGSVTNTMIDGILGMKSAAVSAMKDAWSDIKDAARDNRSGGATGSSAEYIYDAFAGKRQSTQYGWTPPAPSFQQEGGQSTQYYDGYSGWQ